MTDITTQRLTQIRMRAREMARRIQDEADAERRTGTDLAEIALIMRELLRHTATLEACLMHRRIWHMEQDKVISRSGTDSPWMRGQHREEILAIDALIGAETSSEPPGQVLP